MSSSTRGGCCESFESRASPPYLQRLVCDIADSKALEAYGATTKTLEAEWATRVAVTAEAAEQIASNGGKLYLWEEPVGGLLAGEWLMDQASFERPPDVRFETFHARGGGVEILIASEVEPPRWLSIKRSVWRPPMCWRHLKLEIGWDGELWGWRGRALGPE